MEFVSEEEAREYFGHSVSLEDNGYGYNYNMPQKNISKKIVNEECYIGAFVAGNILYVTKSGVSYDKTQAKVFSKADAENKVMFMNKRGTYSWKTIRKN